MTSDGTNSYVWDARNHLASMNLGGVTFEYDGYGRRVAKTTIAGTTNYLYDGANVVQELSGSTVTANLLIGLGIDERFTRTDASGTANFLTDALGSTVELTDSNGNSLATYAYEPFGNTTINSGSSANPFQYTGRENDGTGLYFYRGRYYLATLQRFISEDPARLAGGLNLYAYTNNSPVTFVDQSGLGPTRTGLAVAGVLNIGLGLVQMAAPIAAAPETAGLSLLGSYSVYTGTVRTFAGGAQLIGAISGDVSTGEANGQFLNGLSTVSGSVALAMGASNKQAETASTIEGLALTAGAAGADLPTAKHPQI